MDLKYLQILEKGRVLNQSIMQNCVNINALLKHFNGEKMTRHCLIGFCLLKVPFYDKDFLFASCLSGIFNAIKDITW